MKAFLKKYFKFFVGVGVLLVAIFVFVQTQKTTALESGQLKDWRSASIERRNTAIKVLTASETNSDLLIKCVDKMATLPDSGDMPVRDAVELCFVGIQLKSNI
jgi:hypothetical protein